MDLHFHEVENIWDSVAYSATPYPFTPVPLQGLYLRLTGGYDP